MSAAARPRVKRYACPNCGSTGALATIEQLIGVAYCHAINQPSAGKDAGPRHADETEINWDSSTTVGVACQACQWQHTGADWETQLADGDPDCAIDGTPLKPDGPDGWICPRCEQGYPPHLMPEERKA